MFILNLVLLIIRSHLHLLADITLDCDGPGRGPREAVGIHNISIETEIAEFLVSQKYCNETGTWLYSGGPEISIIMNFWYLIGYLASERFVPESLSNMLSAKLL